jgi:hypothetical protein
MPPKSTSFSLKLSTGPGLIPLRRAITRARGRRGAGWLIGGPRFRRRVARGHHGGGLQPGGPAPHLGPLLVLDRRPVALIWRSSKAPWAVGRPALSTRVPDPVRLGNSLGTPSKRISDPGEEGGLQPLEVDFPASRTPAGFPPRQPRREGSGAQGGGPDHQAAHRGGDDPNEREIPVIRSQHDRNRSDRTLQCPGGDSH